MYDDGFQTSYPVSAEVNTPAEINSAFGSITYSKGASILRMLESTVGEANFREGLNVKLIHSSEKLIFSYQIKKFFSFRILSRIICVKIHSAPRSLPTFTTHFNW